MKKLYIAPEMEILDAEIENILTVSGWDQDNQFLEEGLARQGGGFDDFDDFEEDEF